MPPLTRKRGQCRKYRKTHRRKRQHGGAGWLDWFNGPAARNISPTYLSPPQARRPTSEQASTIINIAPPLPINNGDDESERSSLSDAPPPLIHYKTVEHPKTPATEFLGRPPAENMRHFLQSICSDAYFCMAFGRETERLKIFFDGFTTFKYAIEPAILISSGANGFTNEIIFERDGYKVSTVLKSAIKLTSDNLYVEAYNGFKYINEFNKYFPSWLETYGAFKYNNKTLWKKLQRENEYYFTSAELMEGIIQQPIPEPDITPEVVRNSCIDANYNAILLQYIHNPLTLHAWYSEIRTNEYDMSVELIQILFQIYSTLAVLNTKYGFCHNDLHMGNVLLYEIPNGQFIEITYKNAVGGATISFKTRWIAKIIDYGRCYFKGNEQYYRLLCVNHEVCGGVYDEAHKKFHQCGVGAGYNWWDGELNAENSYVSSRRPNSSIDLMLLFHMFNTYILDKSTNKYKPERYAVLSTPKTSYLKHLMSLLKYDTYYGTPPMENLHSNFDFVINSTVPITTVQELYWALFNIITYAPYFKTDNDAEYTGIPYGKLTVDLTMTTPMSYVTTSSTVDMELARSFEEGPFGPAKTYKPTGYKLPTVEPHISPIISTAV